MAAEARLELPECGVLSASATTVLAMLLREAAVVGLEPRAAGQRAQRASAPQGARLLEVERSLKGQVSVPSSAQMREAAVPGVDLVSTAERLVFARISFLA